MEKNFFIVYLLTILTNIIFSLDDIISFKLESFQYKGDNSNPTIISQLIDTNIITTMRIGSNSYPLKAFINSQNQYFYISTSCNIQKIYYFPEYKTNFNYNRYNSYSFYNTSSFGLTFSKKSKACTAKEDFEILNVKNMVTTKENLNFVLTEDTDEDIPNCLNIGLLENKNKESFFSEYNLITQLKQKKRIKESCWSIIFNKPIKYNNNNLLVDADELLNLKGNLIIGDYLHIFDSNKYYESQMVKTYTTFEANIMKWELKFNKIFYKYNNQEIKILSDNKVGLDPSNYFIVAPGYYFDIITEKYFQKYKDDNICNNDFIDEYIAFYCEKSPKFSINEIKNFPSIYFEHIGLEYTFELSFKDLFIEKDGKYWFLLITDNIYGTEQWILGNIFMRKYQFVFNLESREIGFYNPNLEQKENDENSHKDSSKKLLYALLIIALCIIITGIIYFVKMKFYPSVLKKKRANELDDEFEYVSHKNFNNNNNDDNQLFNESINPA